MSLQKIVEDIKNTQKIANDDLSSAPIETLSGRRGRKNQAIEKLKQLKREYKNNLLKSSAFILVVGPNNKEYANLTESDFGLFQADPEAFYKDLAKRVPKVLYTNKVDVHNVFDVLGRHLEDKMSELDINEYNQLLYKSTGARVIKTEDDLKESVKRAVNDQIGAEIVGIQAVESILDRAIEKGHSDKITPIVMAVSDDKLVAELKKDLPRLTKKIFMVYAGEVPEGSGLKADIIQVSDNNKKSVEKSLSIIKKSLKK